MSRALIAVVAAMLLAGVAVAGESAGAGAAAKVPSGAGLAAPGEKEIAMELVSSAENSTLDWRQEYGYIQDIHDGRGYTAGLIGFCSGTADMLALVRAYAAAEPDDPLSPFVAALARVNGTASHLGLGPPFV